MVSLAPTPRLDALAELVDVAARSNDPHVRDWMEEVDRMAAAEADPCLAGEYRGQMTEILNRRDPDAALQRLRNSSGGCNSSAGPFVAGQVFRAMFAKYRLQSIDGIMQAADRLGSLGQYPYSGISSIYKQIADQDKVAAARMFLQATLNYRNAPELEWAVHTSFLSLVQQANDSVSRESLLEAVQLAVNRMSEKKDNSDAGARQLTLTREAGLRSHTERDDAVSQLHRVALAIDPLVAKRVLEHWPEAAAKPARDEGFVAGVGMLPGTTGIPKTAQRFLEIQQAQQRLANSPLRALQESTASAGVKVAMLANRASFECEKDLDAGRDFLQAADITIGKIADPEERLDATIYVAEAAMRCKATKIAASALENAFSTGLRLIREQAEQTDFELTRSDTYFQLRRTVLAVGVDRQLVLPYIDKLQNDELRARLLTAIVESALQRQ